MCLITCVWVPASLPMYMCVCVFSGEETQCSKKSVQQTSSRQHQCRLQDLARQGQDVQSADLHSFFDA